MANHDSVRCRGPKGAGQLAAVHIIRQIFDLAVVHSQIKVFGTNRGLGQASSSDMAAPHKFHFSRLKVCASTFVVLA